MSKDRGTRSRNQFRLRRGSPQRVIHWSTHLSLLRVKNAGISGLNRTTQAESLYFDLVRFCGAGHRSYQARLGLFYFDLVCFCGACQSTAGLYL